MNIIHSLSLSQKQAKDIRYLTELCHQADGCTLSCPVDGDAFWFLYEESQNGRHGFPAAFFAVYKVEADCWECYAFTRPDRRGRGYFSALLEEAGTYSQEEGEADLCFVTDGRCRDSLDILEHLEAEFWYNEYIMERCLEQNGRIAPDKTADRNQSETEDHGLDFSFRLVKKDTEWELEAPQGSCRLTVRGDGAFLYGLEILPELRGQGTGTRFVRGIISTLEAHGCKTLRLQVSGTNEAALRLYKKTGFVIAQTLSYYLY